MLDRLNINACDEFVLEVNENVETKHDVTCSDSNANGDEDGVDEEIVCDSLSMHGDSIELEINNASACNCNDDQVCINCLRIAIACKCSSSQLCINCLTISNFMTNFEPRLFDDFPCNELEPKDVSDRCLPSNEFLVAKSCEEGIIECVQVQGGTLSERTKKKAKKKKKQASNCGKLHECVVQEESSGTNGNSSLQLQSQEQFTSTPPFPMFDELVCINSHYAFNLEDNVSNLFNMIEEHENMHIEDIDAFKSFDYTSCMDLEVGKICLNEICNETNMDPSHDFNTFAYLDDEEIHLESLELHDEFTLDLHDSFEEVVHNGFINAFPMDALDISMHNSENLIDFLGCFDCCGGYLHKMEHVTSLDLVHELLKDNALHIESTDALNSIPTPYIIDMIIDDDIIDNKCRDAIEHALHLEDKNDKIGIDDMNFEKIDFVMPNEFLHDISSPMTLTDESPSDFMGFDRYLDTVTFTDGSHIDFIGFSNYIEVSYLPWCTYHLDSSIIDLEYDEFSCIKIVGKYTFTIFGKLSQVSKYGGIAWNPLIPYLLEPLPIEPEPPPKEHSDQPIRRNSSFVIRDENFCFKCLWRFKHPVVISPFLNFTIPILDCSLD